MSYCDTGDVPAVGWRRSSEGDKTTLGNRYQRHVVHRRLHRCSSSRCRTLRGPRSTELDSAVSGRHLEAADPPPGTT